jgi:Ca2+-binding RTX toxin-like protein
MAHIIGTSGDDELPGMLGDGINDTIEGGEGSDTVSYANATGSVIVDLSSGFAFPPTFVEFDRLVSIENARGSAFDDFLLGGVGANVLEGAGGNDTLSGQGGSDVFVYSFDVVGGGETFTKFFAAHGGQVVDGKVAPGTSQGQFSSLYTKWLNMLIAEEGLGTKLVDLGQNSGAGGTPVIANMTGEFGDRESFSWTSDSGKKTVTHVRWYSDTWSSGGGEDSVTSADGLDTILDFTEGQDRLNFSGITREQFLANFSADTGQNLAGTAELDTVITIDGVAGWSLTLADFTGDLLAVADNTTFS